MASDSPYDKLDDSMMTGDKDELLDDDITSKQTLPHSESNGSSSAHSGHSELAALKHPKKVLEAGKAVLQDHSRGLRIIVICAFVFSFIITVALILSIYLGPPQIGANAAISTDVKECSDIGLKMLSKGGNAVDAAVAAVFCVGVVNAESSGLGGGGFMLVHDHKIEKSEVFDFREVAPSEATDNMFAGDDTKMKWGGLAVGVPGELKGMAAAHSKYGKLSWSTVVSPSADLARNGFKMTGHTDYVLNHPKFNMDEFMKSKLATFYSDGSGTGNMKKEGDVIKRPDLATTLDKIAENGADIFYTGDMAKDIIDAIVNGDTPGRMKMSDLANYEVEMRDVVKTTYHGYTVESVPAPGSGPVVLSMLNFLEGYGDLKEDSKSYHRLLEAFKFGYAQKEKLGDPKFNKKGIENATKVMISKDEASRLRNLTSDKTQEAKFYESHMGLPSDAGTSHISVIDPAELMVSVTTSINEFFGSMVMTDSGILLNNGMADFGKPGNNLNKIEPGKRPLSSMSPTVVYETGHLCGLRMVCGGANGSRIITGIVESLLNNLTFGMPLEKSISSPRIHSELYPNASVVEAEEGFPKEILTDLVTMGHTVQNVTKEMSIVNAVLKVKDDIEAVADKRKKGAGIAMF